MVKNRIVGFKLDGHANYRYHGYDIVCAAISSLTINAINSLEQIAHKQVDYYDGEGFIEYEIRGKPSIQSNVLLESVSLGYKSIAESYPDNVIFVTSQQE